VSDATPTLSMSKSDVRDLYLGLAAFAQKGPRTLPAILNVGRWTGHLKGLVAGIDEGVLQVQNAFPKITLDSGAGKGQVIAADQLACNLAAQTFLGEPMRVTDLIGKDGAPIRFTASDMPKVDGDDDKAVDARKQLAGIVAQLGPLFIYEA
jgi:hypothetical protein